MLCSYDLIIRANKTFDFQFKSIRESYFMTQLKLDKLLLNYMSGTHIKEDPRHGSNRKIQPWKIRNIPGR